MRTNCLVSGLTAVLIAAALPCPALAETISYVATLTGADEIPPSDSRATGTVEATYDPASSKLAYTITYSGLSGPALSAHLHGAAGRGAVGGMVAEIHGGLASPIRGEVTLTKAEASDLGSGLVYVNLHTALHPAGEIRGQLERR